MLMWERLTSTTPVDSKSGSGPAASTKVIHRLPYDKRCVAITKTGKRCKGGIREGADFCPFHDPSVSAERRRRDAAKGGKGHHRLSRLPDGYLQKLTSRRAVGQAMDRLYRELRLGIVTPEMATVLFNILTRLLDSGLCEREGSSPQGGRRSKAERLRPKLVELLTRAEQQAWRKAVANAPQAFLRNQPPARAEASAEPSETSGQPGGVALTAAS